MFAIRSLVGFLLSPVKEGGGKVCHDDLSARLDEDMFYCSYIIVCGCST